MVSFQGELSAGLNARGIKVSFDLGDTPHDAVLVIGGTRRLHRLWQLKRSGTRIVQRLDGMNWIHRVRKTGLRHWLRAEYGNFILSSIRSSLADNIIYQSNFSRGWWERVKGKTNCPNEVIHNSVNLVAFSPGDGANHPDEFIRVLLVEGSLLGGYEFGLENAVKLSSGIAHSHSSGQQVELMVVGKVSHSTREHWENWITRHGKNGKLSIHWAGSVPHSQIAEIYRSAHIFFSADINAACPNSVIEALACGTPVTAFDTGALPELLGGEGGIAVPYGGDPWQLDSPDIPALTRSALEILKDLGHYQDTARMRAESAFNLDRMVDHYLEFLLG